MFRSARSNRRERVLPPVRWEKERADFSRRLKSFKKMKSSSDWPEHPAFGDIARRLSYDEAADLTQELRLRMTRIRGAYERIVRTETDRDGD